MHLHYAEKYDVRYSPSSSFCSIDQDKIMSVLYSHGCDVYHSDECDAFDISFDEIKNLVEELKESTSREECGIQVEDLICFFDSALQGADCENSEIHFAWF